MHRKISSLIGMDIDDYIRENAEAHYEQFAARMRRVAKAMALAQNVYVCGSLLRGERVPWTALDYFAAERYGLREGTPKDARFSLDDFNDISL